MNDLTITINMNMLNWLQNWYSQFCDGDWEHEYGVKIYTIDNPGWVVKIDLAETGFENIELNYKLYEKSDSDWYSISVKDKIFDGAGDPSKLEYLIRKFKSLIEKYENRL